MDLKRFPSNAFTILGKKVSEFLFLFIDNCPCTSVVAIFGVLKPYSTTIGDPQDAQHQALKAKIEDWVRLGYFYIKEELKGKRFYCFIITSIVFSMYELIYLHFFFSFKQNL